ncbi:adenylate/guanylate cyclase domain-containing protein [Micromonospora sp. WMMD718]|uniref:adenylate/guanylate cyclase domain-containing protein n=1 Tax=Micromonospora sp. WMMD718 TaxID=3016098 RepID=UPI002417E2C0|nr:adenylate/guanylate cyclase domain-containing protein [Micromonospora sp. WMMD718]MDG4755250.1 adenylate/guanylate cyclase domain-containing protein [Micromonospora sp. WMMD718]
MAEDITAAVGAVVNADWNVRTGTVVPTTDTITLKNGAVEVDAVYLYADMANSSGLARDFAPKTAAKVIRAYLDATCRVIKFRGGQIRSFDGDRVMAIFMGAAKNSDAARCALNINYVVRKIVRPALEDRLTSLKTKGFELRHCVGVASGTALIVRGGVRNEDNDLVSIGRPPNVAAKLSDVRAWPYATYITSDVFARLREEVKYVDPGKPDKKLMWDGPRTEDAGGAPVKVYRSSFWWKP